jgi:hypothetical protein
MPPIDTFQHVEESGWQASPARLRMSAIEAALPLR